MKVRVSSVFEAPMETVRTLVGRISTLSFITRPLLGFSIKRIDGEVVEDNEIEDKWGVGQVFELDLRLFSVIPGGRHIIHIDEMTRDQISTSERGKLAKKWDHDIYLEEIDDNTTRYTDAINISSGILTPLIWLYASVFYRYRQRRWRKLLSRYLADEVGSEDLVTNRLSVET